ncbi:hypothetical protein EOM57_03790 [Candidatus Saccharibacteria bacterium]|nr:hypothetical protein [Candidatus Saccharibacteria bacterium]
MLRKIRFWLMIALVFVAPLSLHPSVSLPIYNFSSFRIGLYQILAIFFVVSTITLVWQNSWLFRDRRTLWVSATLAITLVWGVVSTLVLPRTLLYSASLLALIAIGISAYLVFLELNEGRRRLIILSVLWSGVVFGAFAVGQLLLITLGVLPTSMLCSGCTSGVFGFPRVNLTAAEPQFLANSLLPAFFVALAFFRKIQPRWLPVLSLVFTSIAISITFSRGAYLAIGVALVAYLLVLGIERNLGAIKRLTGPIAIVSASFLIGWGLLIGSASIIYSETPNITYNATVSALNHLSLNMINIPEIHDLTPTTIGHSPNPIESDLVEYFDPQGFVEASSGDRLSAASTAIAVWNDTPLSILFGVGMGNLGAYAQQNIMRDLPRDLTVYIFYILILSELGLVGLILLVLTLAIPLFYSHKQLSQPWHALAFTLTLAFAAQFWFFGSYINIIYIPLWTGIIYGIYANKR